MIQSTMEAEKKLGASFFLPWDSGDVGKLGGFFVCVFVPLFVFYFIYYLCA